jgi:hypothetical protein
MPKIADGTSHSSLRSCAVMEAGALSRLLRPDGLYREALRNSAIYNHAL